MSHMHSKSREDYLVITGWMMQDLHLSGTKLLVYAIIYGYSKSGQGCFFGSEDYLATWCSCSKRSVQGALKDLLTSNLICQRGFHVQGSHDTKKYVANLDAIDDISSGEKIAPDETPASDVESNSKNTSHENFSSDQVKNVHTSGEKIAPDNITYNKNDILTDKKEPPLTPPAEIESDFTDLYYMSVNTNSYSKALENYVEARKFFSKETLEAAYKKMIELNLKKELRKDQYLSLTKFCDLDFSRGFKFYLSRIEMDKELKRSFNDKEVSEASLKANLMALDRDFLLLQEELNAAKNEDEYQRIKLTYDKYFEANKHKALSVLEESYA